MFTTIHVMPGLDQPRRRRASRSGPPAVASRRPYRALLTSAGFVDIDETDLTAAFAQTAAAWLTEREGHADVLASLVPAGEFEQRLREGRVQLSAIEDGLLGRSLFVARRRSR